MLLAWLSPHFQLLPPVSTNELDPSSGDSRWVGLCMFQSPMGPSNELCCEAGSFSHCCNSHRFLQPEVLRLQVPMLEPWDTWCISLPSCSSQFIHMQIWDHSIHQPLPCVESSSAWLPISASSTSLDECLFCNSLVVGLPYSSVFWKFLLFFHF